MTEGGALARWGRQAFTRSGSKKKNVVSAEDDNADAAEASGGATPTLTAAAAGEPRHPRAHAKGGMTEDARVVSMQRSVALEILKQVGLNVLRGKDLLYVTLPARSSEAKTVLQKVSESLSYSRDFLPRAAAMGGEPVMRLATVIAFYIAGIHLTSGARKPLNPVLGETYEARIADDAFVYLEQSSHHPPETSFYMSGRGFSYFGALSYSVSFGLNELRLVNRGSRSVCFADGGEVRFNHPVDVFSGLMYGSYRHEVLGTILFEDRANRLSCSVSFKPAGRGRPSDHFFGAVMRAGAEVGRISGSWLGFVDFNGRRLWSVEDSLAERFALARPAPPPAPLPSDSRLRADVVALARGDMNAANIEKRAIEDAQRRDRKLRKAAAEQRAAAAAAAAAAGGGAVRP